MKKILLNFGIKSFSALGFYQYIISLVALIISSRGLLKTRDLSLFDRKIGKWIRNLSIRYKFGNIKVPLQYIDKQIQEDSYSFGLIRELVFRDCYFKHHSELNADKIKTVVDLGGNRGLFSVLCTPFASKIVVVEVLKKYVDVIGYSLKLNNFSNYVIEQKYIGEKGEFEALATEFITFDELLNTHQISEVDFLKVDIEGAEFSLFNSSFPINRVKYISMEVHPKYGRVYDLVDFFKVNNFEVKLANNDLEIVNDPNQFDFLYARNKNF